MLKGIDYSIGSGVTAAQVKAAGFSFVCRYLSNHETLGGVDKDISATEVINYHAAGIALIFNWETSGTDMTSVANGVADARSAQAELEALAAATRQPSIAQAPVIFSADEATESDMTGYMQGVNSVIGKARTGIYGGYGTVKAAFDQGLVTYGWQTFAWSNGQWDNRALIRQVGSVNVGPAQCDLDEAAFWASATILGPSDDFGQWPRPTSVPPSPWPVPTGLTAQEDIGGTRPVTLSWTAVPGCTAYMCEVESAGRLVVNAFDVNSASSTTITLPVGTYRFRVIAHVSATHNWSPWSAWSDEFTLS